MAAEILYLGDTTLDSAASYLSLVLESAGHTYDYVPSERACSSIDTPYQLIIVSDYPARNFGNLAWMEQCVAAGAGLLMIGGWESFQGLDGGYHDSKIEELLPVAISAVDDRQNSADICCITQRQSHPITADLPFYRPPVVSGYNRFTIKAAGSEILTLRRFSTLEKKNVIRFEPVCDDPFLVVGTYGKGRTAALAADLAPHWVGGFVDWGSSRITLTGTGREVEVGNWYHKFVGQLIAWTLGS